MYKSTSVGTENAETKEFFMTFRSQAASKSVSDKDRELGTGMQPDVRRVGRSLRRKHRQKLKASKPTENLEYQPSSPYLRPRRRTGDCNAANELHQVSPPNH